MTTDMPAVDGSGTEMGTYDALITPKQHNIIQNKNLEYHSNNM
jgi:hypothetical protein